MASRNQQMILVTGANGFIGRAVVERLVRDSQSVIRVARSSMSMPGEVILDDIGSFQDWQDVLRGVDVVIHLAARAHILKDPSTDALSEFRAVNTRGTATLARHSASAGVKRFIFVSSIGVNGDETHEKPFSVDDIPRPNSPYAISKLEAESVLKEISRNSKMEVVIIRPPLVYGPGAPGNFRTLVRWVSREVPLPLGSLTSNRRSFVGLDNLADLIASCVNHPAAANQTFLAGDGEDLSTAEFVRRLSLSLGKKSRLVPVSPWIIRRVFDLLGKDDLAKRLLGSLQVDIRHTREQLDWNPPLSVDEGLARCRFDGV